MSIRRKDGSLFKLRGPNKIMVTQEFWDDNERTVVHNFHDLDKIILEEDNPSSPRIELPDEPPVEIETPRPIEAEIEVYIEKAEPPDPPKQEEPEPSPETQLETPRSTHRERQIREFYCLPAKLKRFVDELYDEDMMTIAYENPFNFQVTIPFFSDHKIVLWTTVAKVTDRSILFDRANRRWWRVEAVNPDPSGDGILITCGPSALKPDFSAVAAPISS